MRWVLAALSLIVAAPAAAQVTTSLNPPASADQLYAVQSAIPPVCTTTPAMDTLAGSVGTAAPCTPRADNTRPTVIQAKDVITAADGSYAATFDQAFPQAPRYADARIYGQSQPYLCTITVSATGATGKCYQLVATTLPLTATALLGLVVSPFQAAAASLPVRIVARQ